MKKTMTMVLAIVAALGLIFTANIKAEASNYSKYERRVLNVIFELEEDYEEEDEEIKAAMTIDSSYVEIANGIYDITFIFTVYDENSYEAHIIYDAEDEYELVSYGIIDGARVNIDEWNEYVEGLYPELAGF